MRKRDIFTLIFSSAFLLCYFFVFHPKRYSIVGYSMFPSLSHDNTSWGNAVVNNVQRGDIVAFHHPMFTSLLVKRIVALPKETIQMLGSDTYIDGELLDEPYILFEDDIWKLTHTLGPNEYWIMGDNRPNSADSRYFGPIQRDWIVAKIFWRNGL